MSGSDFVTSDENYCFQKLVYTEQTARGYRISIAHVTINLGANQLMPKKHASSLRMILA